MNQNPVIGAILIELVKRHQALPKYKSNLKFAIKPLGTVVKGEKLKISKHKEKAIRNGATFIPYLVETMGGVG